MAVSDDTSPRPLVTVVIPTYGRPEYLVDAVRSVVDQTYDPVELVVVDDHSPEPIAPVLDDVATDGLDRFRCVRHEENRGANAARRTGIEAGRGEYVAFLDDDDYWRPSLVERAVDAFERDGPSPDVVVVSAEMVDGAGDRIGTTPIAASGRVTPDLLAGDVKAGTFSQTVVRRDLVERVGYPDERLPSWQDKEWHIRLSEHARYASIADLLVVRRVADHEQISDNYAEKRDVSYPLLVSKHRSLAASYGRDCERRFLATLNCTLGFSALRNGEWTSSLSHLVTAIRYNPRLSSAYLYLLLALGGPATFRSVQRLKRELASRR